MFKRYLQFSCETKNWCSKTTPVFVEAMQCETSSWSVPELSFRNATRATWTAKNGHEIDGRITCETVKNERNDDSVNVCFCGKRFEKIWHALKCEAHSDIGLWHRRTSWLGPGLKFQRNIVLNFPSVAGLYLPSGTLQTENCEGTDCWSLSNLSSICRRCCPSKGQVILWCLWRLFHLFLPQRGLSIWPFSTSGLTCRGINLHVMIITEKLGEMCFRSLSLDARMQKIFGILHTTKNVSSQQEIESEIQTERAESRTDAFDGRRNEQKNLPKLMKEGEHHSYNKSGLEFQYQKNFFYWLVRAHRFFHVSNYRSKGHRNKSGTFVDNTVAPFCAQSKVIKEGFDYMCQQVRDSIGSLAAWFKMKYTIVLPVWLSRFTTLPVCIAFTQVLREKILQSQFLAFL